MRRFYSSLSVVALTLATNCALAQATPQGAPQINVPYRCANGITYTILLCKPYGSDQFCQWREDQNGHTVTTVNSTWSAMTGRLQGCTVAATPASAGTKPTQPAPSQAAGSQQSFNPPYLKEFPSVDQVMAQMKGTDAKDTLNRQMASFLQLKKILEDLAGSRWLRGKLTPHEARIHGNYDLAYNNLAKPLNFPDDGYFAMPNFVATLFSTFPMPTVQQLWLAQNAQLAARVKASQQAMQGQPSASSQGTTSSSQGVRPLPATNDPGQLAIRRCAELGGSMLSCIGTGMGTDMTGMMGVNLNALTSSHKAAGLVIFGSYTAPGGLFFAFSDASVNIGGCGKMVQGGHNYSVGAAGGKYTINIANTPQPLVVTLGADGKIAGPAAQDITGQQITGYTVMKNVKTGVEVSRTPIFGPITVHCNVGTLTPGPPMDASPQSPSVATGILTTLQTITGTGSSTSQQQMLPPGPRMAGAFSGTGGLKIQFSDANAVIDCAQAHVKVTYDVANRRGSVVLLKNGSNPFSLRVQSDGSLAGGGTVTVNGKLMTAMQGSDPVFTPTTASCPGSVLVAVNHP